MARSKTTRTKKPAKATTRTTVERAKSLLEGAVSTLDTLLDDMRDARTPAAKRGLVSEAARTALLEAEEAQVELMPLIRASRPA